MSNEVITLQAVHEQIPNAGEDAAPIVLSHREEGVLAVFDGMGGAGSALREVSEGVSHTDAWLASRFVRDSVEAYIREHGMVDEKALVAYLTERLNSYKDELGILPSRLKSSMSRVLPTTMAMLCWNRKDGITTVDSFWSGDSHNYVLLPDGLCALNTDHVRDGGDACYNLHHDPPMTHCICQSEPIYISHWQEAFVQPVILMSCTDGCFGYYDTPYHFEEMLLYTLLHSADAEEWKRQIEEAVLPRTGDDFSFAIAMIGHSFEDWKQCFKERLIHVMGITNRYKAYQETLQQLPTAIEQLWEKYKTDYERYAHRDI